MEIIERVIGAPGEGVLVEPVGGSAVGVLVLAGHRGRPRRTRRPAELTPERSSARLRP
ncbi:hypothetical protein AB0K51_04975 [Kitasatospora sp. NPDC049285]|uniref:hypothetical protein n=1 Tax=Kitasatospora sp. NPDC049285 TaxID=3157096 RepID=UPI003422EDE2